jgi:peptide/nickel transport system substrate-binding protein
MSRRLLAALLVAMIGVAAAVGMTAMASEPSPDPASPAQIDITATTYRAEPVGHTGGAVTIGAWRSPALFDWFYSAGAPENEAMGIAVWSLWNPAPDRRWYPQLATAVPTVENGGVVLRPDGGMDVAIELIPGARWSDGQPITCQDIADMASWLTDPAQGSNLQAPPEGWEDVTSVEGGRGTHCVARLGSQVQMYLWALSYPLLPSHYTRTVPIEDAPTALYPTTDLASGVYSGPYMPTRWVDGQEIDYVPNPSFWETIRPGSPPFDQVVMRTFASPAMPRSHDALIAAFAGGEVDVALDLDHADLPKLVSFPADQVAIADSPSYEHHTWNRQALERAWGQDGATAILEALHYAVDKQAIVDRAVAGAVDPTCSAVSPLDWWYHDTGPCYGYDPARAGAILDAAGFTEGADGIRGRDGRRLELQACTTQGHAVRADTLALLAGQLERVGIVLEVTAVPGYPDYFGGWDEVAADTPCSLAHGNFDLAELAWGPTDPTGAYLGYHSSQRPSQDNPYGDNWSGVDDPEVDALLETAYTAIDTATIAAAMGRFQEVYADPERAFPEIPLYFWKDVTLRGPTLHNVLGDPTSAGAVWNIEDWWRDP